MVLDSDSQRRPPHFPFWNCAGSSRNNGESEPDPAAKQDPPPNRSVKSFVNGIISPFINCVQPPLYACGAPTTSWEPPTVPRHPSMISPDGASSLASFEVSLLQTLQPGNSDVLCGRGGGSSRHPGNQHFRELIGANKVTYSALTKKQKMLMARQIVQVIHSSHGRFLARDAPTGYWQDIGLPRSLEKTSQALRERTVKTPSDTPSMTSPLSETEDGPESIVSCTSDGSDQQTTVAGNKARVKPGLVHAPVVVIPLHLKAVYAPRGPTGRPSPQLPRLQELKYPYPQPSPNGGGNMSMPSSTMLPFRTSRGENQAGLLPPAAILNQQLQQQQQQQQQRFRAETHPYPPPPPPPPRSSSIASIMREKSNISPERQQEWKRQRVATANTTAMGHYEQQLPQTSTHSISAATIKSQLSLEERVIRPLPSPASLQQSRSGGRSRNFGNATANSGGHAKQDYDGLAALSTAAFLRLDESH